jgi:predicted nuclease with TOPRIM domain
LKTEQFLRDLEFDNSLLAGWVEDTLQPSLDIMNLKIGIRDILDDITEQERVKGETKRTTDAKEKFGKMLLVCERLDKIAGQNNTFQLIAKHTLIKLENANGRIKELEDQIKSIEKAWQS